MSKEKPKEPRLTAGRFFSELKERNVRKTLAIYLSAALTIVGMTNVFSLRYQLPQGLFDGILVFVISGFFSAAIFAWYRGKPGTANRRRELILHGSILLIAVGITYDIVSSSRASLLPRNAKTIAVLPFTNLSEDADDAYFSDGMMEDILMHLSKIEDLKVISRTSVMQYRNTTKSIREIGRELGAGSILEGSVRRAGSMVRITGQLINTSTDEHLWAETYDREMSNVFAIQSDVARQIAGALKATLSPDEIRLIDRKPTENLEAYAYYLRGRDLYNQYSKEANDRSVELFQKAIRIDSSFALAYAGLADAYGQRVQRFGYDRAWADTAMALSYKAISLDPDIAEPYKALGLAFSQRDWYRKALEQYSVAVKKNPNLSTAVANNGLMYLWTGDPESALPLIEKSVMLNPGRATGYFHLGSVYETLEFDSLTEAYYRKALEMQPDFVFVYRELSRTYAAQGRTREAIMLLDSVAVHHPDDPTVFLGLGYLKMLLRDNSAAEDLFRKSLDMIGVDAGPTTEIAYLLLKRGEREEAGEFIKMSLDVDTQRIGMEGSENYEYPYDLARVYAIQGDTVLANQWVSRAIDAGWIFRRHLEIDPLLETVHGTPAFQETIERLRSRLATARTNLRDQGLLK